MFGWNDIDDVTDSLSAELCQFAYGEACRIDRSKIQLTQRQKIAAANIEVLKARQRKQETSQWQAAKQLECLRASDPILDLETLWGISYHDLQVDGLREQLRWHQQIDGDEEVPKAVSRLTLGTEGVIPSRQIESFLRDFKQFTHNIPSRKIVGFLKICP